MTFIIYQHRETLLYKNRFIHYYRMFMCPFERADLRKSLKIKGVNVDIGTFNTVQDRTQIEYLKKLYIKLCISI